MTGEFTGLFFYAGEFEFTFLHEFNAGLNVAFDDAHGIDARLKVALFR
jgi:hypothetical protein